jgi:hypothetical protein
MRLFPQLSGRQESRRSVAAGRANGYNAAMDKLQRDVHGEIFQDELTENQSKARGPERDDAEHVTTYDPGIDSQEADAAMAENRFGQNTQPREKQ